MKSMIISIIIYIILLLLIAGIHINFGPFKITLEEPLKALLWIFILAALVVNTLIQYKKEKKEYEKGYIEGLTEGSATVIGKTLGGEAEKMYRVKRAKSLAEKEQK